MRCISPVTMLLVVGLALSCPSPDSAAEVPRFDGRPAIEEGPERGYFVWRDGEIWHVRWTARGAQRHFTGEVVAEGGKLKSLKRIGLDTEVLARSQGQSGGVIVSPEAPYGKVVKSRPPSVRTRPQDHVDKESDREIRWNSRTDTDVDGFDFKVTVDVLSLRFLCAIDGQAVPADVFAGSGRVHPDLNPFVVALK